MKKLKSTNVIKFGLSPQLLGLISGMALLSLGTNNASAVGATMPFTSVEAESGTLAGGATVQALTSRPTNSDSSPTLEASGHAYVQLSATGQSVSLQNNTGQSITALNIRYCIPDSAGGGGITATLNLYVDGVFRQAINLNSMQTWCYQTSGSQHGWSQAPSAGKPHIFYDEAHFFISAPAVPAGSTIKLQKDSANSAAFYYIDVVDMENPPGPLSQPANSLSITDYGAVANNSSSDSESAIQNCINAAQSQGKSVWIPQGTFYLHNATPSLSANGITIQGAGMWYSTIYANPDLPANPNGNILYPTACTIKNLAFDSNSRSGGSGDGNPGGLNVKGNNWTIDSVWIQHMGAGIWADGSYGMIKNCRTGCTWADGINVNNGNGGSGNDTGNYLTISNCFVRGSGDDGLALNSGGDPGCKQMTNTTVVSCTSVAPWWANCLGIYGGVNILVSNNLCMDSVGAFGISVGQFGTGGAPLQSGTVVNNTIIRGGSYGFYNQNGVPALNVGTTATIQNVNVGYNIVNNAMFMGVGFEKCGSGVTVQGNIVNAPGTTGFLIPSGSSGSAQIQYNTAANLASGQSAFINNASGTFTANLTGNSWQVSKQLVVGNTVSLLAQANSKYVCADNGGTNALIAKSTSVGQWEQFKVVDAGSGNIGLQAMANNKYVCADNGGSSALIANRTSVGPWESFTEVPTSGGNIGLYALANGKFVCADSGGASALIANRTSVGSWESFTVGTVSGASVTFYQDTSYGGTASQGLAKGTYTTSQLSAKGVVNDWASSVRIPSGWTVIMYSGDNFSGTSWTLSSDTPDFTTLSPSANDQMSSCKIQ